MNFLLKSALAALIGGALIVGMAAHTFGIKEDHFDVFPDDQDFEWDDVAQWEYERYCEEMREVGE